MNADRVASAPPAATSVSERAHVVDALRGFALWGILLANIYWFSFWPRLPEDFRDVAIGEFANEAVRAVNYILIDGKFYTLFALLFGLGFTLQMARLEARSSHAAAIFLRRLFVLFLIGMVHLAFMWEGDILTVYAICGAFLLIVRAWSDRALLTGAAILILLPIAGTALFKFNGWPLDAGLYAAADWIWTAMDAPRDMEDADLLRSGNVKDFLAYTFSGVPYRFALILESWRFPKIIGTMIIGMWLGRRLIGGDFSLSDRFLWTVLGVGLVSGIAAGFAYFQAGSLYQQDVQKALLAALSYAFAVTPLGLAYAAGFILVFRHARSLVAWLAPMGRMALTNYLMHTAFCIYIFYGIGPSLGLIERLTPLQFYPLAIGVLIFQAVVSTLWLNAFRFGPVEWLWRWGTYGTMPKMRI